ncbi:MAG: hypothetical protein AB9891_10995 [Anaerolineaceae bacterium]
MALRIRYDRKRGGIGTVISIILTALAVILLFNGPGTTPARAAPMEQNGDPYQLCDLIKGFVSEIEDTKNDFDCVGIARYVVTPAEGNMPEVKSPIKIYVFVYRDQKEARTYAGEGSVINTEQAKWQPVKLGDFGQENWLTWDENRVDYGLGFAQGCYTVIVSGPSKNNGAATGIETDAHSWATQIEPKIVGRGNTCPRSEGGNQPAQPAQPAQPGGQTNKPSGTAEQKFTLLGIGCSGSAQETGQSGRVICAAQTANEPFDEPAVYNWSIDGQPVGSTRKLTAEGVSKGEHTVSVNATFRNQQYSYSGWVTVTESGAVATYFGLTAGCSYDQAKGAVTCHATPANPPENADLEYFWIIDGVFDRSKTADASVKVPPGSHTYTIEVRAWDKKSDMFSNLVSTSVTTGAAPIIPAAVGQAVNTALTGEANPPKPNPEGAAGGGSLVALGMGLAALVNGLVNSAPAAVKNAATQAATAVQQTAAEVVNEVKNIPGVKAVENAVTFAVAEAEVKQAIKDFAQPDGDKKPVKGEKTPSSQEGPEFPSMLNTKEIPLISELVENAGGSDKSAGSGSKEKDPSEKTTKTENPAASQDKPAGQSTADSSSAADAWEGWDDPGSDQKSNKPESSTGSKPSTSDDEQVGWGDWDEPKQENPYMTGKAPYAYFTRDEILNRFESENIFVGSEFDNPEATEASHKIRDTLANWIVKDTQIQHERNKLSALEANTGEVSYENREKIFDLRTKIIKLGAEAWQMEEDLKIQTQRRSDILNSLKGGLV